MNVEKFVLFLIIFLRKYTKIDGGLDAVKESNNIGEFTNEEIDAVLNDLSLSDLESLSYLIDTYGASSDNSQGQSSTNFESLTMDYDEAFGENIDENPELLGDFEFDETYLPNGAMFQEQQYNDKEYIKQLQDSFPRDKNAILSNVDNVEQPHIRVKRN